MNRRLRTLLLAGLLFLGTALAGSVVSASADPGTAVPVSSADLIEQAPLYDGRTVVFEGEAVGDLLVRGDHAWINVSDGANAVGVWAPSEMVPASLGFGRYGVVGDRLRIVAVFYRSCAEHGGDFDLHAASIEVVASGKTVPESIPTGLWIGAIGSFAALVLGAVLFRKRLALLLRRT